MISTVGVSSFNSRCRCGRRARFIRRCARCESRRVCVRSMYRWNRSPRSPFYFSRAYLAEVD